VGPVELWANLSRDFLADGRAIAKTLRPDGDGVTFASLPVPCPVVFSRAVIAAGFFLAVAASSAPTPGAFSNAFVNFETVPVHPIALSPDRSRLAVCNLPDAKLEIFDVTPGRPVALGSVPVGLDPVSVRFRTATEAWVVNHISDSISIVDITALGVTATLDTLDTPSDVAFAGAPARAFVSCARPNTVQVFDAAAREWVTNIVIEAERPKALAVSPDGRKVYAAIFESGNATTLVGGRFRNLLFFDNAVSRTNGPYGGQNPPPNRGASFDPPLNPALPTNLPPPRTGLIVRKNTASRWLDDNQRDWTEFVSGTNAALTQRVPGWDLPDRDVAILDTADYSVSYATGLMNLCMTLEVNPVSGRIVVVGTDAINEVRFEPNLNGIFVRGKVALVDPLDLGKTVKDLNPHLDYTVRTLPPSERDKSVGDPRGIAWTADGTRGYVAGMGSRNLILIDGDGNRLALPPIEVGEGPCGLALDEPRQRLYVFNRFSSSLSVADTATGAVIDAVPLFDPTPVTIAAGRRHLYDTRRTSGLGQASCASCHVDARVDRLGWDLGNPAGDMARRPVNHLGFLVTNDYHPMKGVMLTQTLQDIIGHEPFHWRGDRPDLESFNATFTNLQAAATAPTAAEMRELLDFLASIRFPPNPYRHFDNSLSTNVPLPGLVALGQDVLLAGAPLPNGNAVAGLGAFSQPGNFCNSCHTLPTGLGSDVALQGGALKPVPVGPNGEHHFPLAFRLEGTLRSKVAQFRNLADRIGMDGTRTNSRAGFGFGHDGSVDSLTRFLHGVRVIPDQAVADLSALLLSVSGSDIGAADAPVDPSPPSAVGRQLTLHSAGRPPLFDAMLALARSPTSRVDLIAKGMKDGVARGWFYQRTSDLFQSDRRQEAVSPDGLLALAGPGSEITFTVVPSGSGIRLGIDRDLDGLLDRDELDAGTNPSDRQLLPLILPPSSGVAVGSDVQLEARIPPMPAPGQITWWKDGQVIADATNATLTLTNATFATSGDYRVVLTTPFQSFSSEPFHLAVAPLVVSVSPAAQAVWRGSNAAFTAAVVGLGPFQYQWQFNAQDLPGATNASLVLSNAQVADEGAYRATVANAYGAATSAPVNLGVLVGLTALVPPLNQRVVEGGNATFSLMISGHPPPFGYQLLRSSAILTNYTSDERLGFLTLFNVQPTNAGTYRIVVSNAATPALTFSPLLTVLSDADHDGLPDEWEAAHELDTNNAADAGLDLDRDGLTNGQEYRAGTDPRDPQSFFRVESILFAAEDAAIVIQFNAVSNRTYTLQYQSSLTGHAWTKRADFVALPANRLVSITNAISESAARFYRLITPQTP
jgi:YVTN family beta-propeller protein